MHPPDPTRPTHAPTPEQQAEDAADARDFEVCAAFVRAHAAGEVEGMYGPGSVTWAIWREPLMLAAGLPAVLLQVAHPAIGTGVAELSRYKVDMLGRAWRTMSSLYELIFSDLPTALAASRRLHLTHRRVRGTIRDPGGPLDGQPYRANEQHLLRWVSATVSVCGLQLHERAIRPLTPAERRRWFQEYRVAAASVGVRPDTLPDTLPAMEAWYDAELRAPHLRVGPAARDIARALFNTAATRGPLDEWVAAALLPPQWREAYDLPWGPRHASAAEAACRSMRALHRAPAPARAVPAWHQARLRLDRARGRRGDPLARLLNRIDRRIDLPGSIRPIAPHLTPPQGGDKNAPAA